VGPEKTEDLALADLEVDVIHRDKAAIALGQPPGLDDAGHRRPYLEMPKASTTTAAAMTPSPVTPHSVDVSTVTRKLALSEAPSQLARTDTTLPPAIAFSEGFIETVTSLDLPGAISVISPRSNLTSPPDAGPAEKLTSRAGAVPVFSS